MKLLCGPLILLLLTACNQLSEEEAPVEMRDEELIPVVAETISVAEERSPYQQSYDTCTSDRTRLYSMLGTYNPERAARLYVRITKKEGDEEAYRGCLDALRDAEPESP